MHFKSIDICKYSAFGTRCKNEDSFACYVGKDSAVAVVCDGLGGHGEGDLASAAATMALGQYVLDEALPDKAQILAWMNEANDIILNKRKETWQMKTTAVALYAADGCAIWAHTGDSRLYHYYNGELADYTIDQSLCQLYVYQGLIKRSDIPGHPDRSKILNVIGEESIKPVIHDRLELLPGQHAFLLCSDGLWERLTDEEIGAALNIIPAEGASKRYASRAEEWLANLRTCADSKKCTDIDNNTAVTLIIEV